MITIGMGPDAEDGIEDVIDVVERGRPRARSRSTITGEFTADDDFLDALEQGSEGGRALLRAAGGADRAAARLRRGRRLARSRSCSRSSRSSSRSRSSRSSARSGRSRSSSSTCSPGWGSRSASTTRSSSSRRFREERARGVEKIEAIAATGRTASRAVLFSGTAFVIALTGMLLVPDTILRSLAAGAVLVGITAVAAAMTLLPALLSLLGDRVDALRLPFVGRGARRGAVLGRRSSRGCSGGRSPASLVSTALLVALALPALDLRTGSAGVRTIPDGYASKDGFNALEREFGVGTVDSVEIVVEGDVGSDRRSRRAIEQAASTDARRRPGLPRARGRDRRRTAARDRRGAGRGRQPRRGSGAGGRAAAIGASCRRRSAAPAPAST